MGRLRRAANVRDDEVGVIRLIALVFAALEMGRGLGEVGVNTLVLSRLPADALPWLYIPLGAISLVIAVPTGLAVAIVQASARLSLKAAAAALGVAKAAMAEPAAAERTTGYVVGAVSPFGQRKPLPTVLDSSALAWDRVFCSAGRRGWDVAVAPQDLVRVTGAVTADIQV